MSKLHSSVLSQIPTASGSIRMSYVRQQQHIPSASGRIRMSYVRQLNTSDCLVFVTDQQHTTTATHPTASYPFNATQQQQRLHSIHTCGDKTRRCTRTWRAAERGRKGVGLRLRLPSVVFLIGVGTFIQEEELHISSSTSDIVLINVACSTSTHGLLKPSFIKSPLVDYYVLVHLLQELCSRSNSWAI
jgi:hypothetical protein